MCSGGAQLWWSSWVFTQPLRRSGCSPRVYVLLSSLIFEPEFSASHGAKCHVWTHAIQFPQQCWAEFSKSGNCEQYMLHVNLNNESKQQQSKNRSSSGWFFILHPLFSIEATFPVSSVGRVSACSLLFSQDQVEIPVQCRVDPARHTEGPHLPAVTSALRSNTAAQDTSYIPTFHTLSSSQLLTIFSALRCLEELFI